MTWFFAILIVLALGGIALVASGYGAPLASAVERQDLVLRALHVLAQDVTARVDLDAVDVFDVGGAAPSRHQTIGRRAAVFIREDHRIAVPFAAIGWLNLVPHQQWHVVELPDGILARVHDRRQ